MNDDFSLYLTLSYSIIKDEQANLTNPFLMSSLYQVSDLLSRTFFVPENFLDQWIKCQDVSPLLLMPSLYLTVFRMSRTFFVTQNFFGSTWMVSSFFMSTRTSKSPCLILYGLIIPWSEPNVKNFFRSGRIFLDVRHMLDLMRKSKGRTARSYSPPFMSPL